MSPSPILERRGRGVTAAHRERTAQPMGGRHGVRVHTVVSGDPHDGVRVYGIALAEARAATGAPTTWGDVETGVPVDAEVVHAHVTDRELDDRPGAWAEVLDPSGGSGRRRRPVVVTLHDVPTPEEGAERFRRRASACRSICGGVDLVVVSSRHEQRLAAALGVDSVVVDHPIFPSTTPGPHFVTDPVEMSRRSITVAGFVHPGKGIVEFVESLGDLRGTVLDGWQLRLVGGCRPDHRDLLRRIERATDDAGLALTTTGEVDDGRWWRELAAATIPVAPHRHCSASGSMLAWSSAGRRPMVGPIPFALELAAQRPDAVRVVDDPSRWRAELLQAASERDPCRIDVGDWRSVDDSVRMFDTAVSERLVASRSSGNRTVGDGGRP